MRSIAGWPQRGNGYFLPRAQMIPDEALCAQIWPEVDVWLERMEAYHPDRTDNEVVRLDLAGSGFLRLLRTLRVILLQDSVVLRQQFPRHPLWADPLFNCEEYRRFAAQVERSLVDVVTPEELTMQKYWPAQEAVAKLRHEAAIAAIKKAAEVVRVNSETVRSISNRLDRMERSLASTPPAPVWVPGFWAEPAASIRPSSDRSRRPRSIPAPASAPAPAPAAAAAAAAVSEAAAASSPPQAGVGSAHQVPPPPYVPSLLSLPRTLGRLTSVTSLAARNLRLQRGHPSLSTRTRPR
jgi:hypothetical protein